MGSCRRSAWAICVLVGMLVLLVSLSSAAALEDPQVKIFAVRDSQVSAQVAVAAEAGIFKKHGLSPEIQWIVSTIDLINMIPSPEVNVFGLGMAQMAILRAQDYAIYWLATLSDIAGTQVVVLGPTGAAKVREPKDMERLKIGILTGSASPILLNNGGRIFGLDPTKAQWVNIGPPENVTALAKGDVDAIVTWEPWGTNALKAAPGARVYFSGNHSFVPGYEGPRRIYLNHTGLVVTKRYIDKNPETVRALVRSLAEATDYINKDLERAIGMVSRQMRIPAESLQSQMKRNRYTAVIDRETLDSGRQFVDYFYGAKRISKAPDPGVFFYTKFLTEVSPELAKISANEMR